LFLYLVHEGLSESGVDCLSLMSEVFESKAEYLASQHEQVHAVEESDGVEGGLEEAIILQRLLEERVHLFAVLALMSESNDLPGDHENRVDAVF